MREIYADFNNIAADGTLALTCDGSRNSIEALTNPLSEQERVWLSDGELRVQATVHLTDAGSWIARSDWSFVR